MAGRHGPKAAGTTQTHRAPQAGARHRPPGSPSSLVLDVPPPRGATAATSPPLASSRRRRWPWIVGGLALLIAVVVGVNSAGSDPVTPVATAPPAPVVAPPAAPVAAAAGTVMLPRAGGRDGASVIEELGRLGLTKVRLVTDDGRTVEDPGKWTVVGLQPRPGTEVTADRTIVLTVTQER